jgi:transcriptional regulator with XRE-family HTH domain
MKRRSLQERIGHALRRYREAQNCSQEGFADQIEMHRAYYGAIERGKKNLQLKTLERICIGLDVAMWEVIREAELQ